MKVQPPTIADLGEKFLIGQPNPCHIDEISKYIIRYRSCTPESAIRLLARDKRFLMAGHRYIGLQSKNYDLAKWKKQHFKLFGTIGDFAEEFLATQDEPCHIDEITRYITKYRKHNTLTVMQCLYEDKRFFTMRPGYAGLHSKNYNLDEWRTKNIAIFGTLADMAEQFLANKDEPIHISEIAEHISQKRACKATNLIQRCISDARFMVIKPQYIGLHSKNYNLSEWKKKNIAVFGTIGDFIEKFLANKDTPCHIEDIAQYVLKHRKSSLKGIRRVYIADKRFVSVMPNYAGLRSKKYRLDEWKKKNLKLFASIADYAEEFLSKQGTPGNIDEIIKYTKKYRKVGHRRTVMERLLRDPKRFLHFPPGFVGLRSKKYNLRKWKKENLAVLGTVADLASQFLASRKLPCHKDEIARYISKYRSCTPGHLFWTCGSDNRFITIHPGYIGLAAKRYNLEKWKKQNIAVFSTITGFAIEFLTTQPAPCHINAIVKYIAKYRQSNARSVMMLIRKDKRFFTIEPGYVGLHAKNYDLEKWKKQNIGLLGSICDITEDFLARRDEPCPAKQIAAHIKKYPNCKADTVMQLCRNDRRFITIQPGFVGLKAKRYNLDEWKKKNKAIFGSTGDIAAGFMATQHSLCHIKVVVQYVRKIRKIGIVPIRGQIKKDNRFVLYSKGYIGLWGKEYDEGELEKHKVIKAATIGDIVEQFIAKHKGPRPINEIGQYIGQYRKIDPKWIAGQLKQDKRFRVLKNAVVGLRKRK